MTEEDSEGLGDREDELPVREGEEELFVQVFGKQEGTFLRARRAKVEALARKRAEILQECHGVPWPRIRAMPFL